MHWLNRLISITVSLSLLALTGCIYLDTPSTAVDVPVQISPRDYWPTEDWQRKTVMTSNGSALFDDLSTEVSNSLPFVNSMIVVYRGYVVYEDYFNGFSPEDLQLQQSVSKSIASALVGIALDRGDISSLDLTLGEVLPEYFENGQSAISPNISIRDLLMMRSGITYDAISLQTEFESPEAYNAYLDTQLQGHLINSVLAVPQAHDPGTAWQYSTADVQLLSEMFQKLVGQSLSEYADQYLFSPLGIKGNIWRHDGTGVTVGGGLLWLRPVDMAKFGYLFLNDGYWDGSQIIPKEWVQASIQPQGKAIDVTTRAVEPITYYGYLWWLWEPGSFGLPKGAYQAVGYGGQIILVLPDIDTIIVATSNALVNGQVSDKQQKALTKLVDQYVIRQLASPKGSLQMIDK